MGLLDAIVRLVDRAKKNPQGLLSRLHSLTESSCPRPPLQQKKKKKKRKRAGPDSPGNGPVGDKGKGKGSGNKGDDSWVTVVTKREEGFG